MRTLMPIAIATALLFYACSTGLPHPDYVPQPTSALAEVPFPPPPARVELVPKQPERDAVWVDGEWVWRHTHWAWKQGAWVVPPAGAAFSPWTTTRSDDGTLYFAAGVWRDARGREVPAPAPITWGTARPGAVVDPEGIKEDTGGIVRPPPPPPIDGGS